MKILSTVVRGYQRFDLNPAMNHFEYVTRNKVQIVIGTNASGKSSLVALYTLWPADHAELHADGYIHIIVEKKGVIYKLSVIKTDNGAKYHFVRDGEELNDLNRITSQKELVTKYFGITQQIHSLMIGEETFVNMSPMARRNWIVKLSEMDYDYIMKIYNSIKKKMSYYKDVLKHNNKQIIENNAYIESIDIDKMNNDHTETTAELNSLIDKKTVMPMTLYEIESRLRTLTRDILSNEAKDNELLSRIDRGCDALGFETEDIANHHKQYNVRIQNKQVLIDDISSKVKRLTESTPSMDIKEIGRLKKELARLDEVQLPEVEKMYQVENPTEHLSKLYMLSKRVDELVNSMDFNIEYTTYKQHSLTTELRELSARHDTLSKAYETSNSDNIKFEVSLENDAVECPECATSFRVGYDKCNHDEAKLRREKLFEEKQNNETLLEQKTEELRVHTEQNKLRATLRNLLNVNNWTTSFNDCEMADYRYLTSFIRRHGTNVRLWETVKSHMDARGEIERDLNLYNNVDILNIKAKNDEIARLNDEIIQHVGDKNKATVTFKKLSMVLKAQEESQELSDDIKSIDREVSQLKQSLVVVSEQAVISKQIMDAKMRLAKIDSDLSNMKVKVGIVDKLKEVSAEYEELLRGVKELFEHLSPTDGFIAYSLIGFIDNFIGNINKRIADVWEYPLRISPPMNATESLNFKFKLHIDNTKPKSDISKGSSAIKQIINLAFTLSVLDLVGLSDHPIILDEIGAPMDSQHSINVYRYIKDGLINTRDNQVFIISHDRTMYSIFDDTMTDYLAVDERNIDGISQISTLNDGLTRL